MIMCNMLLPHCSQTEEIDEIKIVLGNRIRRSCKAREVTERATKSRLVCPAGRPAGYTRDLLTDSKTKTTTRARFSQDN